MVEEIFLDSLLGAQDDAEAEDVRLFLPDCPSRAGRRGSALALHCGIYILTMSCLHVSLGTLCVRCPRGHQIPGTGTTGSCEPSCWC